jgi:hypothetical protein
MGNYYTVNGYRHNLKSYRLTFEFLYDRSYDRNSERCPVCLDTFWSSAGFSLNFKLQNTNSFRSELLGFWTFSIVR